jgi:ornithine carbamoyltransferase
MKVRVASPPGYELSGTDAELTSDPEAAVAGADVVYTDVWTSMGQEAEAAVRNEAFAGFLVDDELMSRAAPTAIFLHCLPAHRGQEVTTTVIDGPQSRVWQQAENRMHTARGLLSFLLS